MVRKKCVKHVISEHITVPWGLGTVSGVQAVAVEVLQQFSDFVGEVELSHDT